MSLDYTLLEPLDISFYQPPYNVIRRAKALLFITALNEHNEYNDYKKHNEHKQKIIVDIENACYNYTVKKANEENIPSEWASELFKEIYHAVCAKIYSNLSKYSGVNNYYLINNIFNDTIDINKIPYMSSQELFPDKYKDLISKLEASKNVSRTIKTTSMYKCRRCHKNECTEENRYNRSLDEGVNLTITCMSCGFQWNA
jgi:DNA-directed RNA polymerase subunit M/transcription elongation factor TFIIS